MGCDDIGREPTQEEICRSREELKKKFLEILQESPGALRLEDLLLKAGFFLRGTNLHNGKIDFAIYALLVSGEIALTRPKDRPRKEVLEERIFKALQKTPKHALRVEFLAKRIKAEHEEVREVVWKLIERGKLQVGRNWEVELPKKR